MTDILILGDVHAQPQDITRQLDVSKRMGYAPQAIIQLGDIGIWRDVIKKFPRLDIPLYYILGNHEDFHAEIMIKGLPDCYIQLSPTEITNICGLRAVGIGKSKYIDSHNTPPGTTIRYQEVEACMRKKPLIDLMITHDCPSNIGMRSNFFGPWEDVGSEFLEELFITMHLSKPKLWLFAHHHMDYTVYIDNCHFVGFGVANDGFGILDTRYNSIRFASSIKEAI